MTKDVARQELTETARLLLAALAAEERVVRLRSSASLEEAEAVRREAERLRSVAMDRFRLMCRRLACGVSDGLTRV